MTADAPSTDPATADTGADATASTSRVASAGDEHSDRVLDAYAARMRVTRLRYYAAIAAVVAVVVVVVSVAWSRGEVAHTTLKPAATPGPSIAVQTPAATVASAWTSTDHTAIGAPFWGGTVITYDAHTVRGRNATTGAVTWSYTRTDRTVCQTMQVQGVTVAIYQLHGNCDEVTALNSETGRRDWTRTLDENGQPILGHPTYQVTPYTVLIVSPAVIYAIDPSTGIDRWVFGQSTCTIRHAVLGNAGALISQTCTNPQCAGLTFCHAGPQLLFRDGSDAQNNDDKHKANPDLIFWELANTTWTPASADQVVSAVDPSTNRLVELDTTKGTTRTSITLSRAATDLNSITPLASERLELIWIDGVVYALSLVDGTVQWSSSTPSPPTATTTNPAATVGLPDLSQAILAAPSAAGVQVLDPATGRVARTVAVSALPAGSTVYPLGAGFVVAGPTTAVYR